MYGLEPARFLAMDGKVQRGIKQLVQVNNPGAGNEWVATVPGGEQWRILAGRFVFGASAAVANRLVTLVCTVEGQRVGRWWDNSVVTASGSVEYTLSPAELGPAVTHGNGLCLIGYPLIYLPPGSTIGSLTGSLDVADQYVGINLFVERVYLPDQKLDEIAELQQQAYFAAMRKAGLTQGV